MEEALWEWLTDNSADGANIHHHLRLRPATAGPLLFGLRVLTKLLIPPLFVVRCVRRLVTRNTYRW